MKIKPPQALLHMEMRTFRTKMYATAVIVVHRVLHDGTDGVWHAEMFAGHLPCVILVIKAVTTL